MDDAHAAKHPPQQHRDREGAAPRALTSEVADPASLSAAQVERLYALHAAHYDGADPSRFRADLAEKQWVILLRERESGRIVGFSTQVLMEVLVEGQPARALFSGDTIIEREHWGTQELVRAWCRFAGRLKAEAGDAPLYWFLISKGHRTYLYLPLFFRDYYPRPDRPTPPYAAELLRVLAETRYPGRYDPAAGLIEPSGEHDRLKPELDSADHRSGNPHVAFFLERNPRYAEGLELACLAEISPENMRGSARRELEAKVVVIAPRDRQSSAR